MGAFRSRGIEVVEAVSVNRLHGTAQSPLPSGRVGACWFVKVKVVPVVPTDAVLSKLPAEQRGLFAAVCTRNDKMHAEVADDGSVIVLPERTY